MRKWEMDWLFLDFLVTTGLLPSSGYCYFRRSGNWMWKWPWKVEDWTEQFCQWDPPNQHSCISAFLPSNPHPHLHPHPRVLITFLDEFSSIIVLTIHYPLSIINYQFSLILLFFLPCASSLQFAIRHHPGLSIDTWTRSTCLESRPLKSQLLLRPCSFD